MTIIELYHLAQLGGFKLISPGKLSQSTNSEA